MSHHGRTRDREPPDEPENVPLSPRATRLAAALTDWPRRRVTLTDLWRLLDQADPASSTQPTRRALLAETLADLADGGLLTLPAAQSWDRTASPHLPRFVTLPPTPTAPPPPRVVWHPALHWASETRLTPTQRQRLQQINAWLHRRSGTITVPTKERSLDIFGHEKTLDRLLPTGLFAPDRLTLALLCTRRAAPMLTTEQVGDGDILLIAENSDTFDSLSRVLSGRPGRVRRVGWGAGHAFEASVLSVPRLADARDISEIRYFGDLDAKGLQIPAAAARIADADHLPTVQPAYGLNAAMLSQATPQPGQPRQTATNAATLADWLPEALRGFAAEHLRAGRRLAQEAIGLEYLTTHDDWLADLT
jgi:hypothetical protein